MSTSDILYTRASRSGVARPRLGTDSPDSGYSGLLQSTPTTSSVRGGTKRPSYASNSHLDDVIASSALYARSSPFRQSSRRPVKNARRDSAVEHQASTFLAQDMGLLSPLAKSFPAKYGGLELVIERQPESHHRARYQKEGSRGCIKDRSGNACPAIQLKGLQHAAVLQIFVANESGKVQAHPLYRACKVGGKNSTVCRDRMIQNITVLEMDVQRENDGFVNIDCMGILKLRNADLEASMKAEDAGGRRRKREPVVRLVFRAITRCGQTPVTLQVCSTPVCCTPSPGVPEIHRISHRTCPASGGLELFILGRNFVKDDTKIFIQEVSERGDDEVIWEREVSLLREYSHAVHLVAIIPPHHDLLISQTARVQIVVKNKGKVSEPCAFAYVPDDAVERLLQDNHLSRMIGVNEDEWMETESVTSSTTMSTVLAARRFETEDLSSDIRSRCCSTASSSVYSMTSEAVLDARFTSLGMVKRPASFMAQVGSVASYGLQASGSSRPNMIPIPNIGQTAHIQTNSITQTQVHADFPTTSSYFNPHNNDLSSQSVYDVQQMSQFLQNFDSSALSPSDITRLMREDPSNVPNSEEAADDLFSQLLKEIMYK